jgi:WD40 repeat protein
MRALFLGQLNSAALALALGAVLCAAGLAAHHALAVPADPARPAAPAGDEPRPAARPPRDALGDPLPPGAVARLGTDRFRHTQTVRSVAYSADGSRLVTASWDRTVRLWDVKTGRELRRFAVPGGGSGAAVAPNGKLVVSGDMDATLIFWDAATGRELHRTAKLENTIFTIVFSPDGRLVAAQSGDALRLWDAATRKELHWLSLPKGGARPLAFTPDGKALAAGCGDGTVRLWETATGKESLCLTGHEGRVWAFAFAADGKTVTTVGATRDRTVRVWDMATGREQKRWARSLADFEEKLPKGSGKVPEPSATACDGRTLAVGGPDGRVHVWDVAAGKERGTLRGPGQDDERGPWVMGLALSPDGRTLAVSTTRKAITFWSTATLKESPVYPGHRDAVNAVTFVAGGLASGGEDGGVCDWDAAGKQRHRQEAHPVGIKALVASPDGRTLITAGGDGKVRVWDVPTYKEVRQWTAHKEWIENVTLSPDGKVLATGARVDHAIRLWGLDGKKKLTINLESTGNDGNLPLCFSPNGKVLASGSGDRTKSVLYLWDAATGKELHRIPERVSGRCSLAFTRDGQCLAVAGGKTIRLFDTATGQRVGGLDGDSDAGTCIAFSPDGRLLAAGGGPHQPTVRLWEVASGQLVGKREGHKGWLRCIAFSPEGRTIATGSEDTTALLWDVTTFGGGKSAGGIDAVWADLAADDAARARRAVWALASNPARSVPFLAGRLSPVPPPDQARVARLVGDLDDDNFDVRERATRELERLGEGAGPALHKVMAGNQSAEVRRRARGLLEKLGGPVGPEQLRGIRAAEVLERIGTPEARRALARLAKGLADARLTREAKAALARLTGEAP